SPGETGAIDGRARLHQRRDREQALRGRDNREEPPLVRLSKARRPLPPGGDRAHPRLECRSRPRHPLAFAGAGRARERSRRGPMSVQLRRMPAALEPQPPLPTPVPPPPRLQLSGICKTRSRRPILDSVDLVLVRGMLVALVGANGVGKTTLLRIVAGLIAPESGTVRLDGIDVSAERREYQQS